MDVKKLGTSGMPEKPDRQSARYLTAGDALKSVNDSFDHWTGKLTESSFNLSIGVIAANWAVFDSSLNKLMENGYSLLSITLVMISLGIDLLGTRHMGELLRKRYAYAEFDPVRWNQEFEGVLGRIDPWPFTPQIERLAHVLRECRTWLPVAGGVLFIAALFHARGVI